VNQISRRLSLNRDIGVERERDLGEEESYDDDGDQSAISNP
jgi:hypothetical protein